MRSKTKVKLLNYVALALLFTLVILLSCWSIRNNSVHVYGILNVEDRSFSECTQVQQTVEDALNNADTEDGCGLHGGHPTFIPYTEHDYLILEGIKECSHHVDQTLPTRANLTLLQCKQEMRAASIPSIISQFDRIWFIGDSLMRQQFWTLLCMLHPHRHEVEQRLNFTDPTTVEGDCSTTFNGTFLRYSKFGWLADTKERVLYQGDFVEAIRTYTERDAIVINAGHHYNAERTGILSQSANFISQMSFQSKASVFFVETTDEQWPTSNGIFSESCAYPELCQCESLTPERVLGLGHAYDPSVNMTNDRSDVLAMYGESFVTKASCVPDCLPANWRNDLVNPILKNGRVHVVPVWRQLVAEGIVNSMMASSDCTHKSVDALIGMNYQLGRTMLEVVKQRPV